MEERELKTGATPQVAYTIEQINYIRQVLISNSETITFLLLSLAKNNIDMPRCTSADEIATCLRILETEATYVQ